MHTFSSDDVQVAVGAKKLPAWRRSWWHRTICSGRGHLSPGALLASDNETDLTRVTISVSWRCIRCGVAFVRAFSVPTPDCDEAKIALGRVLDQHVSNLHLDVLYELNLGRWMMMRQPLRMAPDVIASIPGFKTM